MKFEKVIGASLKVKDEVFDHDPNLAPATKMRVKAIIANTLRMVPLTHDHQYDFIDDYLPFDVDGDWYKQVRGGKR